MQAKFLAEKNARHMARAQEPVFKMVFMSLNYWFQNLAGVERFGCLQLSVVFWSCCHKVRSRVETGRFDSI